MLKFDVEYQIGHEAVVDEIEAGSAEEAKAKVLKGYEGVAEDRKPVFISVAPAEDTP